MEGRSHRGQLAVMQSIVLLLLFHRVGLLQVGHEDGEADRKVTDTADTGCTGA